MSAPQLALSVLDLVPVRSDQATSDALQATLGLARIADELGYRRYWLAEHHNMPAVAATNRVSSSARGTSALRGRAKIEQAARASLRARDRRVEIP
jgi:alkanesulfonate monooxygenase SsuD/methylene tetrahydromethanopterin reductase-like flavin-dependent oxidoreductase (luciferase family)